MSTFDFFKAEYRDGGPWGKKPSSPRRNQSGRNSEQPDIDDLIRGAQERMKGMMGNGGGPRGTQQGGGFFGLIAVVAALAWLASGFYIVAPDEQGVVLRFGKYIQTTEAGPNYHLPWPIETVTKPKVTRENIAEIGFRSSVPANQFVGRRFQRQLSNNQVRDISQESLMLTGDENIIDLDFTVRWRISDPRQFLFNVASPEEGVKHVSESAMREVIGKHTIDDVLTEKKFEIETQAKALIQEIVDSYGLGVIISGVDLQQTNPPKDVIPAYNDVKAAFADAERVQNESKGYANDILPRARGQVAQIMQDAEAYKAAKIASASGAAQRFEAQLVEYRKAKDITRKRLYLETMEGVMENSKKVLITGEGGSNILPYLPLNEIKGGKK